MDRKFRVFDLNILTVDVIESYRKAHPQGFDPEEITDSGFRMMGNRDVVISIDGRVLLSTSVVAKLLGSTSCRAWNATFGRTHMYLWDTELSEDVLWHASYPSRNDRETWCRERNMNVAAWIENLAAEGLS